MQKKHKQLLACLVIPPAVGALSALLSRQGMRAFGTLKKPPLSPPTWLFPVVWTILFLMMGLASWLVLHRGQAQRPALALPVYGLQLFFNFFWSLLFFRWGLFFPALLWLAVLWGLVVWNIRLFFQVRPASAWLLIPYLAWVSFAAYLNAGIWLLN